MINVTEKKKLLTQIEDINHRFMTAYTYDRLMKSTMKMNILPSMEDVTFKQAKYELDLITEQLVDDDNENTW